MLGRRKEDIRTFKDVVRERAFVLIEESLGRSLKDEEKILTFTPDISWGDYAFPCFPIAREKGKEANAVANELVETINGRLTKEGIIEKAEAKGPFVNFYIRSITNKVLEEIDKRGKAYGMKKEGGKKILFEFSQPNTHKEFHVGHVRGTVLGQALANLFRELGNTVYAVNYQGDTGSHVSKVLWALESFHKDDPEPKDRASYLGKIYVEATQALAMNRSLEKNVFEVEERFFKGDRALKRIWKKTRSWSIEEFEEIYRELGVVFEKNYYESNMEKPGIKLVRKLIDKGIAEKSDGAIIVNLQKYNLDILVVLKSGGIPLYATKDLALALKKKKDFKKVDESIVQTDARQTLYFKQLFKIFELIGIKTALTHLTYEMVTLPSGTMSSRTGNIVTYSFLRDELIKRVKEETIKRHKEWDEEKVLNVARALALATIKFEMMKTDSGKVITFDMEKALSFDGFTASYLLYTLARIESVIKKSGRKITGNGKEHLLSSPEERLLVRFLAEYPDVIINASAVKNPALLVNYLYETAKAFTAFYHAKKILEEDGDVRDARLKLIGGVKLVMEKGLCVLGIPTVGEM